MTDAHTGLCYRPNTYDIKSIRGQSSYLLLFDRAINVLDIGGNLGAFANYAFSHGASRVWSYEPEPDNWRLLQRNKSGEAHKIFNMAVAREDGEAYFYVNRGKIKGLHSMVPKRGREKISVKTIDIRKVFDGRNIDTVKIDIEGFEYELLKNFRFPNCVRNFAIEYHVKPRFDQDERAMELHEWIKSQGFRTYHHSSLYSTWAVEIIYRRT